MQEADDEGDDDDDDGDEDDDDEDEEEDEEKAGDAGISKSGKEASKKQKVNISGPLKRLGIERCEFLVKSPGAEIKFSVPKGCQMIIVVSCRALPVKRVPHQRRGNRIKTMRMR